MGSVVNSPVPPQPGEFWASCQASRKTFTVQVRGSQLDWTKEGPSRVVAVLRDLHRTISAKCIDQTVRRRRSRTVTSHVGDSSEEAGKRDVLRSVEETRVDSGVMRLSSSSGYVALWVPQPVGADSWCP